MGVEWLSMRHIELVMLASVYHLTWVGNWDPSSTYELRPV